MNVRLAAVLLVLLAASTTVRADALIPYMAVPWGQAVLLPFVVLAEAPFIRRHAGGGLGCAVWHSLVANIGSTVVGIVLYFATMPLIGEHLFRYWSQSQRTSGGIITSVLISGGFAVVLWLVSYVVEAFTLVFLRRTVDPSRLWRASLQANMLTYAALLTLAVVIGA